MHSATVTARAVCPPPTLSHIYLSLSLLPSCTLDKARKLHVPSQWLRGNFDLTPHSCCKLSYSLPDSENPASERGVVQWSPSSCPRLLQLSFWPGPKARKGLLTCKHKFTYVSKVEPKCISNAYYIRNCRLQPVCVSDTILYMGFDYMKERKAEQSNEISQLFQSLFSLRTFIDCLSISFCLRELRQKARSITWQ